MKSAAIFFVLVVVTAGGWYVLQTSEVSRTPEEGSSQILGDGIVAVNLPETLGEKEQIGKAAFDAACSACHGASGQGRKDIAPPLIHKIYEPGHHGDMAFVLAAKNGVRAHHWGFGSMPAVEDVTQADVLNIVAYIRLVQRENDIN